MFILIGSHEAHQRLSPVVGPIVVAVLLVLLGRVLAVYPFCGLFTRSKLRVDAR